MKKRTQKKRDWDEVIKALKETHTISVRDMCEMLKTSRSWVNRYILPNLNDIIFLNNTIRADQQQKYRMNWAYIASLQLKKEHLIKDSVWCSDEEFKKIIYSSIVSVTKQTKLVPKEFFVSDRDAYVQEYNYILEKIGECKESLKEVYSMKKVIEISELKKKQEDCFNKLLSKKGKKLLVEGETNIVARTKTEAITVALPEDINIGDWIAPHDIKNYGDTDEAIYRRFFKNGYIRIELAILDEIGFASKKIYYVEDPEMLYHEYINEYITVKEEVWQKVKDDIYMV